MQDSKFYNSQGRLTVYALACGYIELTEHNGQALSLWHEGGAYQVRVHDHTTGKRILWDSFYSLLEARDRYDRAKKTLGFRKP
jgi:hypothetical protein